MGYAQQEHQMSIRQACIVFNLSVSVYYYERKSKPDDDLIADLLRDLARSHNQWGFWMMHHVLRRMEYSWNHKKVYRIYCALKLNRRRKYKKRLPQRIKQPLVQPLFPNITWSMDFMQDRLINGQKIRSFNVIDDFNREALNITLDTSINSARVIRELEKLIQWRGVPERIRVDNGPEFISHALKEWCGSDEKNIELVFIQKGKPTQNGYVERFNRSFREEVLDNYCFDSLIQAKALANAWVWVYNNERPHSSLGYLTPCDFALKHAERKTAPSFQIDSNRKWSTLVLTASN